MARLQPATYRRLAKLCLRHRGGDYYEAADHLVEQLQLPPDDARRVKRIIAHYIRLQKKEG